MRNKLYFVKSICFAWMVFVISNSDEYLVHIQTSKYLDMSLLHVPVATSNWSKFLHMFQIACLYLLLEKLMLWQNVFFIIAMPFHSSNNPLCKNIHK